jgi:hypothetical protein
MATTPNVSSEQIVKQTIRANTPQGANSYSSNPLATINASTTVSGLWRLSVTDTSAAFTLTGGAGTTPGLTGSSTVAALVSGLTTALGTGVFFQVEAATANLLGLTTTDILIPTGASLTVSGSTASLTNVAIATASGTTAYPNYYGTPNAAPTWVDDATVHAYPLSGNGAVTQDTTKTVQVQVRQINTSNGPDAGLETQNWAGYFAAYQSNLNQTRQKNTKTQQC